MSDEAVRVLIVDDDQVDRMAVRRALRATGRVVEVEEAEDVPAALERLRGRSFDCVFLDYQLPGGDGIRVLREVRARGLTTPIVMLTGQSDNELAVELMKAGATDYLTKSAVSPERLERTLQYALRVHQAEEQARQAERALRESEARFRVLHETSPDGFMIYRSVRDPSGRIFDFACEYVNPAAERMAQRPAAELYARRMLEVLPGNAETGLFDLYTEVVETGEPRQAETRYTHDGLDFWLRVTAVKLEDGFAVGFSDVTARRQAEEERERALAARSRFYAAMSHELRTPMNAILGYTDLLLAGAYGDMTAPQLQGVERTHRAAQHLLELVNDVLDLSKLEAGKLEVQPEPVSLPALVEDLFATVQPLAEEGHTELLFEAGDCTAPVVTDPRRVRQIVLNLLSNAIKFGEGRPVRVRCRQEDGAGAVLEVVDEGAGIAAADVPRVFEEFVQLQAGAERGTGLGLPISLRFAQLLGGRLEVESVVGRGSTFRLFLPPTIPPSLTGAPPPEHGPLHRA